MIKPTVGRIVWYRPGRHENIGHRVGEPLAALIAGVNSDGDVNLTVSDVEGRTHSRFAVTLAQEGEAMDDNYAYCEWMPYQKGQAAKTEAAERALAPHPEDTAQAPNRTPASEREIEQEIQAKGLNAPRLTPAHIDSLIVTEKHYVFPGTTLTVCALTLRNGFIVTGESAAASPENFNEEIGRKIARDNARAKIWALEGYLLRERLAHGNPAYVDVIFAGSPGPTGGAFVEVEDPKGRSVNTGDWIDRGDGYWALRIFRNA